MNRPADPRLVWLASVLAAAVFILYVTLGLGFFRRCMTPFPCGLTGMDDLATLEQTMNI